MKNLRKMTMLLFVAATMITFSSCNKDDDDNGSSSGGSTPTLEHLGTRTSSSANEK